MKFRNFFNKDNVVMFVKENRLPIFFLVAFFVKTIILNQILGILFFQFVILRTLSVSFLTATIVFTPLMFLPERPKRVGSYLLAFLLGFLIVGDLVYYRYFMDFPSVGLAQGAGQIMDVLPALMSLFKFSFLLFMADLPLALFLEKKFSAHVKGVRMRAKLRATTTGLILGLAALLLATAFYIDRNHYFLRSLNNAYSNRITAEKYGFLMAHGIDIYKIIYQTFDKISPEEESAVIQFIKENSYKAKRNEQTGIAKKKNIIVIQVESLPNSVIGKKVEGQELTPNINRFLKETHYFENHLYEMGGGSTSDTDFTINTSLFPNPNEAIFVKYGRNDFTSLPRELVNAGYNTSAYHGYYAGFWNRKVAYSSLGYQSFKAAESYPESYIVNMGLNDEVFLEKTLDYIEDQPKPSFSYVVTLSNHHPFWLDHDKRFLNLDESKYPGNVHGFFQTVRYTDEYIGKFLEGLKKSGLYEDSVVALYGDHNPHIEAYKSDEYGINTAASDFREVPMLIKLPGQKNGVVHREISSHIDFAPTIMNLVGIKPKAPMLGRDLFGDEEPFFAALWFFDPELVYAGNLRYRGLDGGVKKCEVLREGDYVGTNLSECDGLSERKDALQENSSKLIRYNLFHYFN